MFKAGKTVDISKIRGVWTYLSMRSMGNHKGNVRYGGGRMMPHRETLKNLKKIYEKVGSKGSLM